MKTIYPSKRKPLSGSSRKEIAGLSNAELASRAGVSVRTVQRYKAGTSLNKRVMEEIVKVYEKELKSKMKTLKKYVKEEGDVSVLLKKIEMERGAGVYDISDKKGIEIEKIIKKYEKTLSAKTLTVEGYKDWKKNVETAAEKTFGFKGERLTSAIQAFKKLEGDNTTREYLEKKYNKGRRFDSKQRVAVINIIFSSSLYKDTDYDEIYEKISKEASDWKKGLRQIEEEELWEW